MSVPSLGHQLFGRPIDDYEILHELASGGMGSIFVARKVGMGGFERLFALKALHPHLASKTHFVYMFLDEARLAARIHHPNVVAIHDIRRNDDLLYLVMDFIEGGAAKDLMVATRRRGEGIPIHVTLRIVLDTLMGLQAAHELTDRDGTPLNLVHRDISPHNILVGVDGIARLTDFGIAKAEHRLSSTATGELKGKVAYMAPEQAEHNDSDVRSDVFSMGVVMWEMLTGRRLFEAGATPATLKRLLFEPIPSVVSAAPEPSEVAALEPILGRALARPPDERFSSAADMRLAIERVLPTMGKRPGNQEVGAFVRELLHERIAALHSAVRIAKEAIDRGEAPIGRSQAAALRADDTQVVGADEGTGTPTDSSLSTGADLRHSKHIERHLALLREMGHTEPSLDRLLGRAYLSLGAQGTIRNDSSAPANEMDCEAYLEAVANELGAAVGAMARVRFSEWGCEALDERLGH